MNPHPFIVPHCDGVVCLHMLTTRISQSHYSNDAFGVELVAVKEGGLLKE